MRAAILSLLLIGTLAADQIRIDHREGATGNFAPVNLTTLAGYVLTFDVNGNPVIGPGGGAGVTDGNKGDITVAGSGANWVINPASVTLGKLADLAQGKLIGRWTGSTGVPEAITIGPDFLTTAGTLSLAVAPVGLATNNTWTGTNTFSGNVTGTGAWNLSGATVSLGSISGDFIVPTEAYDATGWNADNSVPTKDAVRDKIESMGDVTQAGNNAFTGANTFANAAGLGLTNADAPLYWGTGDVALYRLAAANLRLGAPPSATPVAQKLTVGEASRPGTDTDVAGASGTIQSGLGTGAATPSTLIFQTPLAVASGSATQTYATRMQVDSSGISVANVAAGYIWTSRSKMLSPADGFIRLSNNAGTDFTFLQFGGTTNAFPAFKRNGASLNVRLADDSANTSLAVANLTAVAGTFSGAISATGITGTGSVIAGTAQRFAWTTRSEMSSPADGVIQLTNAAATDFSRLQLGGTTSAFPAIKRSGVGVAIRLADDSADASLTAGAATFSGNVTLAENASIALDPAGSADGKFTGTTVTGTGGDTIAFGDLVTLDKDDSRWEKVDISVAAAATGDARGLIGIAVSSSTNGTAITVLLHGIIRADANFPTLTIGAAVFASTTGDIVVTQPVTVDHVIRIIGHALTADEIFFNPDNAWTTHT